MLRPRVWCAGLLALLLLAAVLVGAQPAAQQSAPPVRPAQAEAPADPLGRDTPRGTVFGFIAAARKGSETAPQYLNTRLRGEAAAALAHKLFVVLDSRLPARLNTLSDRPEGSMPNPLKPDQDIVGTIATASGPLDIIVERVSRSAQPPVWLFSRATLDTVPDVFQEVNLVSVDSYLPGFLTQRRIGGVRLFGWLVCLLVIPLCYRLIGMLSSLAGRALALVRRRREPGGKPADLLPGPVRLLLLAITVRWLLSRFELSLIERQFWAAAVAMLALIAVVWLLLRLSAKTERYLRRTVAASQTGDTTALLRLARRAVDVMVIAAGVLVALHYFGVDPTAALAGLGIGGIAVALAAQKTLENVIGGFSIFLDRAVRVGDVLKLGDVVGTVDHIGLRSTRIRTLDRTILSVPNGQIANVNIESMSARDKNWFHHFIALRHETTASQMREVVDGLGDVLAAHPDVEADSIRVRFFRVGAFSLDIEVFAYVSGGDWARFLQVQQDLLLRMMEMIEDAGVALALPAQTLKITETNVPREFVVDK